MRLAIDLDGNSAL